VRPPPPPRRIVPLLAAVAGVVLAHALDYALVFPQDAARDGHLQATGHAYWPVAVGAAAAAGALALVAAAARGARRGVAFRADIRVGWLLGFQVAAFVVMEAGERAVVGLPPTVLLHSPEFWLGLALQVPVAILARRLLGAVDEVAYRLASSGGRRPARRAPGLVVRISFADVPPAGAPADCPRSRAPPALLAFA